MLECHDAYNADGTNNENYYDTVVVSISQESLASLAEYYGHHGTAKSPKPNEQVGGSSSSTAPPPKKDKPSMIDVLRRVAPALLDISSHKKDVFVLDTYLAHEVFLTLS